MHLTRRRRVVRHPRVGRHGQIAGDPDDFVPPIRPQALQRLAAHRTDVPETASERVAASVLLLSAAGLYALMAFTVAQRRREIGIRSALGAQPGQLMAAVFRRAFWQIAAGAAFGMLAAYLVGRYVPIEQIGGWPIPGVLPGAAAFMLLVGVLASLGPARRSLRMDPTEALRSE